MKKTDIGVAICYLDENNSELFHDGVTHASYGYIEKVYWGEHGDMIPIKAEASSTTYYCDYSYVAGSGGITIRSGHGGSDNGASPFSIVVIAVICLDPKEVLVSNTVALYRL